MAKTLQRPRRICWRNLVDATRRTARVLLPLCAFATGVPAQEAALERFSDRSGERVGRPEAFGPANYAWRLQTLDGRLVSFSDFRGRPVFLNVWATWCVPCVAELGSIQALADSLADVGVAFVLLSPEPAAAVRRFAQRNRIDAPIYTEVDLVPSEFRLRGVPTTYVIDPSGEITLRRYGAAHWDTAAMRTYLRGLATQFARTTNARAGDAPLHRAPTPR